MWRGKMRRKLRKLSKGEDASLLVERRNAIRKEVR
jgi:hypothetical protein